MPNPEQHRLSKSTLFAGVIAAITASACCLGPLITGSGAFAAAIKVAENGARVACCAG